MAGSPAGLLIAFEGIDGAGKTTQVDLLLADLRAQGVDVLATKEPSTGPWGALIRASARTGRLPPREELDAFVNDRREHVRDVLEPALEAGHVVIVDRYFLSTVAYQGARGLDPDEVFRLNEFAPRPHLLFILDVPPRVGLERVAKRGDVADLFEREDELSKAREIFTNRELLERHVRRVHILDALRTKQDLSKEIWQRVSEARSELAATRGAADSKAKRPVA